MEARSRPLPDNGPPDASENSSGLQKGEGIVRPAAVEHLLDSLSSPKLENTVFGLSIIGIEHTMTPSIRHFRV